MNADQVDRKYINEDVVIDFQKMKNLYPHTFNKRTIQRSMERLDRKEKKRN